MTTYNYPVIQGELTGQRLKSLRKRKGIKVPAVCAYMGGISEQAVYKWERGACLPTIENLLALSRLYEVQIEDLLVYEEVNVTSFFVLFQSSAKKFCIILLAVFCVLFK